MNAYWLLWHSNQNLQKCMQSAKIINLALIDGHGVGVWGCAHPPKNLKLPDTPPCRRQGGCAPWCQRPRRKIFHAHPGGSIFSHFLAKSPRCLLNKPPKKKLFDTPVPEPPQKFFGRQRRPKIISRHTQCVHTPLDPRPVPTYESNGRA